MMITPPSIEDDWGMSERSQALGGPAPTSFHSWLRGDTTGAGRLLFSWPPGSSADSYHAYRLNLKASSMINTPQKFLKKRLIHNRRCHPRSTLISEVVSKETEAREGGI